eukprot:9177764-Pyramimonas_sp.AAC.2
MANRNPKRQLEWTREDIGTTRLVLPGKVGPPWSSCIRQSTKDPDSRQVIEGRSVNLIVGRERMRGFQGKPKHQRGLQL